MRFALLLTILLTGCAESARDVGKRMLADELCTSRAPCPMVRVQLEDDDIEYTIVWSEEDDDVERDSDPLRSEFWSSMDELECAEEPPSCHAILSQDDNGQLIIHIDDGKEIKKIPTGLHAPQSN